MGGTAKKDAQASGRRHRLATRVAVLVAAVALGVVLGLVVIPAIDEAIKERNPPGEYLYLDSDRVNAYLGQIGGGVPKSEKRTARTQRQASATAKGTAFELGGTLTEEESREATVTPTAADRFYRLRDDLGKTNDEPQRRRSGDFDLAGIEEGGFIEISDARLRIPGYAALFPQVSYAKQDVSERKRKISPTLLAELRDKERDRRREFFKLVGTDPRLPFVVYANLPDCEQTPRQQCRVKIFVPLRSSKLALEPALMAGRLRIFGKVIRVVGEHDQSYRDIQTITAYGRALRYTTSAIRSDVHIDRSGDHGYKSEVERSATIGYPGLVVLPIAVYL